MQRSFDHFRELFELGLDRTCIRLSRIDLVLDARQEGQGREQILYGPVVNVKDDSAEFFFCYGENAMGEFNGSFQGRFPVKGPMQMKAFTMRKE